MRRPRRSRSGGWRGVVALALIGAVLGPGRPASATGYAPEPYCQLHVLGSLYGDASGNGPANGAAWDPSTTSWRLRAGNASAADRFERCARWMVANDVGGNAGAKVARRNNSVTLTDFWPAGQRRPVPARPDDERRHAGLAAGQARLHHERHRGRGRGLRPLQRDVRHRADRRQLPHHRRGHQPGVLRAHRGAPAARDRRRAHDARSPPRARAASRRPSTSWPRASRPRCASAAATSRSSRTGRSPPATASRATATWPATPAVSPTPLHRRRHHPRCRCASTRPRSPSEGPAP